MSVIICSPLFLLLLGHVRRERAWAEVGREEQAQPYLGSRPEPANPYFGFCFRSSRGEGGGSLLSSRCNAPSLPCLDRGALLCASDDTQIWGRVPRLCWPVVRSVGLLMILFCRAWICVHADRPMTNCSPPIFQDKNVGRRMSHREGGRPMCEASYFYLLT